MSTNKTNETKETKVCKCCGQVLPIEQFSKNKQQKDGHACYCKECAKEKVQEAQAKKKFDDVVGWRASQMACQANHNYENGHIETETVRDMLMEHLINNNGKCPKCGVKYNLVADEKSNPDTVSIDHVVPHKKGGWNEYDNIQFMCSRCNSKKRTKIERL